MLSFLRIAGAVLLVVACLLGRASWIWVSGAPWFPAQRCPWRHRPDHPRRPCRCPRRRYVTRPVRATLNNTVTLILLALVMAPVVTAWTLAALGTVLFGSAAAWRLRLYLDRRVVVDVGTPIPNPPTRRDATRPPAPTAHRPAELSDAQARATTTRRLLRELEAPR